MRLWVRLKAFNNRQILDSQEFGDFVEDAKKLAKKIGFEVVMES